MALAWDQMGTIDFLLDLEKLPAPHIPKPAEHRVFASFTRDERLDIFYAAQRLPHSSVEKMFRVSKNGIWRIRNEFYHLLQKRSQ